MNNNYMSDKEIKDLEIIVKEAEFEFRTKTRILVQLVRQTQEEHRQATEDNQKYYLNGKLRRLNAEIARNRKFGKEQACEKYIANKISEMTQFYANKEKIRAEAERIWREASRLSLLMQTQPVVNADKSLMLRTGLDNHLEIGMEKRQAPPPPAQESGRE